MTKAVKLSINDCRGKILEIRKIKEDMRDKGRMTNPITGVITRFVSGDITEK
jgi:hypothetical protein